MTATFEKYVSSLQRTEWAALNESARYHQNLLVRLVRHAHHALPFYQSQLAPLFASSGEVDLTRWNEVPILTREDIVARNADLRVANLAAEYGEVAEIQTSGSTGAPLQMAVNGMVTFATNALFTRTARRFGMDTSRPFARIGGFRTERVADYPKGSTNKGWSFADSSAPYHKLKVATPTAQQVEWLGRTRAPYVATMPSNALAVCHAVTPGLGRALGIERVVLIGETVPDGARELIAERLGARSVAIYACQEIGQIASECEAGQYHVEVENALVEIIDEEGRDVAPGGRGRVVVTGLYNYAMPFIRYEIGDIAVAGRERCSCGRALPVIKQIEGRSRNTFVFRDGARFWPRSAVVQPMYAFVPFSRYQLVQLDHETIELRYVPDGSRRKADVVAVNAYAREAIHPSVTVRLVEVDSFAPGPSGKIQQFICALPALQIAATAGVPD